jgi:hypothetical protein
MRPGLLLLIVVLNVRGEKLSVVGLAIEVRVTKFVLLLLFWGKAIERLCYNHYCTLDF